MPVPDLLPSRSARRLFAAALMAVALSADASLAANILVDGDFPPDLAPPQFGGWQLGIGGSFVAADRLGQAGSRALRATAPAGSYRESAYQCIDIDFLLDPTPYSFEIWSRVNSGGVTVVLDFLSGPQCSGDYIGSSNASSFSPTWSQLRLTGSTDSRAASVLVTVVAAHDQQTSALLDDARLDLGTGMPENTVVNGGFDPGLTMAFWNLSGGYPSGTDSRGVGTSGSLVYSGNASKSFAHQCVWLEDGFNANSTYNAVVSALVQSGTLFVGIDEFATTDCSGNVDQFEIMRFDTSTEWLSDSSLLDVLPTTRSIKIDLFGSTADGGSPRIFVDDVGLIESNCLSSNDELCLLDRYRVFLSYFLPGNAERQFAKAEPFTDSAGFFRFFARDNLEVSVKMVDGCGVNGRAWVYVGGMTDLRTELVFHDVVTGATYEVTSPGGVAYPPVTDVNALPACSP